MSVGGHIPINSNDVPPKFTNIEITVSVQVMLVFLFSVLKSIGHRYCILKAFEGIHKEMYSWISV